MKPKNKIQAECQIKEEFGHLAYQEGVDWERTNLNKNEKETKDKNKQWNYCREWQMLRYKEAIASHFFSLGGLAPLTLTRQSIRSWNCTAVSALSNCWWQHACQVATSPVNSLAKQIQYLIKCQFVLCLHSILLDYKNQCNITNWVHCGFTSIEVIPCIKPVTKYIVNLNLCSSFHKRTQT